MYRDLADAVESFKEKGYTHNFIFEDNSITCEELDQSFTIDDLKIVESYNQDAGTDPGSESTVYALEATDGTKGTLIIGFGIYSDPTKAKIVDALLKSKDGQ